MVMDQGQLVMIMATILRANPNGRPGGGQASIEECIREAREIRDMADQWLPPRENEGNNRQKI